MGQSIEHSTLDMLMRRLSTRWSSETLDWLSSEITLQATKQLPQFPELLILLMEGQDIENAFPKSKIISNINTAEDVVLIHSLFKGICANLSLVQSADESKERLHLRNTFPMELIDQVLGHIFLEKPELEEDSKMRLDGARTEITNKRTKAFKYFRGKLEAKINILEFLQHDRNETDTNFNPQKVVSEFNEYFDDQVWEYIERKIEYKELLARIKLKYNEIVAKIKEGIRNTCEALNDGVFEEIYLVTVDEEMLNSDNPFPSLEESYLKLLQALDDGYNSLDQQFR